MSKKLNLIFVDTNLFEVELDGEFVGVISGRFADDKQTVEHWNFRFKNDRFSRYESKCFGALVKRVNQYYN